MKDSTQKLYEVALVMLPGVGAVLAKQLVSYCGSAEQVFRTPRGRLLKVPGIGEKIAESLLQPAEALKRAEAELAKAGQHGADLRFYTDPNYPTRLRELADAPALLYAQGAADLGAARTLAIVGTRKATEYGRQVTDQMVEGLKKYNPLIVSGLAYGIDIYAHRAALKHGLATVGVLGSGLDVVYPHAHRGTATQMLAQGGGLLTEYPFGTAPDAPHFPSRNRIIAGLADAVLVVEAAASGGALITAEIADGYHREVFAVPGSLHNPASEGCHWLIKNHKAHLVTSADDLAYLMQWETGPTPAKASKKLAAIPPDLPPDEVTVLSLLAQQPEMQLDDIGWQSQLGVSRAAVALLSLEFQGLVKSLPGKRFART
jgi:DNA processing protein